MLKSKEHWSNSTVNFSSRVLFRSHYLNWNLYCFSSEFLLSRTDVSCGSGSVNLGKLPLCFSSVTAKLTLWLQFWPFLEWVGFGLGSLWHLISVSEKTKTSCCWDCRSSDVHLNTFENGRAGITALLNTVTH